MIREAAPPIETAATSATALVLLCGALSELGNGLDLSDIERSLHESDPGLRVGIVADLCNKPKAIEEAAAEGADRAVLGLCSSDRGGQEFDHHARQAGLDPFGVTTVNLGGFCARAHPKELATNKAKVLLAAAVARARAFRGSGPEHVKPHLGWSEGRVSRRALFTLPPITYQAVASVQAQRCASGAGCDLCTAVCPQGALSVKDSHVTVNKNACTACGLCVSTCPRGAIELATASLAQIEAQMATLLRTPVPGSAEGRGILFTCERNAAVLEALPEKGLSYPPGWLPLLVPCAGMVSGPWLLSCLAWGAGAVAVLACAGECACRKQEHIEGTVAYCREALAMLGGSPDDVRLLRPSPETSLAEDLNRPLGRGAQLRAGDGERPIFSGPSAAAQAIQRLALFYSLSEPLTVIHPFSPLGLVRIAGDKCTACGGCARVCPTDALICQDGDGATSLTFDAALCTGCLQCIGRCPEAAEHALSVDKATDLQALSQGRVTLHQDTDVRCESCGDVIAPAAMLRRIDALLSRDGGTSGGTMAAIRKRCPSCRVARTRLGG